MRVRAARLPVYRITGTRLGHSEDVRGRERRYLISMSVRTTCFVLAVVADGWLRWAFFAGAILLPYIAVVLANAGREQPEPIPVSVLNDGRRALDAAPREAA